MSYGEQMLTVNGVNVGKVRVLDVYAGGAITPRLDLRLGFTLATGVRWRFDDVESIRGQLHDVTGELRLAEHGESTGFLCWTGNQPRVYPSQSEHQVTMACDLDPWRVRRIEAWRNGASPKFWVAIWPTLVDQNGWYDAQVPSFPVTVPREKWLEVLNKWGVADYALLEVPRSAFDRQRFGEAVGYLEKARQLVDTGHQDRAVGECRLAIDAMFPPLIAATGKSDLAGHFASVVPAERASAYAKLLRALKEVTHMPHHTSSNAHGFRRSEAIFVVQTTEHFLALAGDITSS
jgi:hypothetical protein